MDYQKRLGTSGVEGQFYETKLIALVMLRLLNDDRVADFCLATNMNKMGAFDDICVKVSVVGREQPLTLFIQLKHKIHDDAFLTINDSKTDLIKYVDSFVTITNKICSQKDRDYFFDKNIYKTDSIFILYTNAEFKVTNSALKSEDLFTKFVRNDDSLINQLLVTGDSVGRGLRPSERLVLDIAESKLEEDLTLLAERFATYLCDKTKQAHIMNDEYLQQYHVVLTRHVLEVGDIQTDKADLKWRTLSFRHEFFESQHKPVALFRHNLFQQILKKHPKTKCRGTDSTSTEASVDDLIASFLLHKSAAALSPLIATHIATNEDGSLQFLIDRPDSDVEQLSQMTVSPQTTAEAYLRALRLNVPVGFGNIDMVLSGGPKKVEKRLIYLVTGILGLCQRYKRVESLKVVTIDDTVDGGLLTHGGGLASGIGNVLTWDESTAMLMFADCYTPNQSNAETLYKKLKEKMDGMDHLSSYRFEVKTTKLPKLRFDCTDTARQFISKLVIYDKQSNQFQVEKHLKDEIQNLLYKKANHSALQCRSVFLHYHDEVVNWWMRQSGTYLNKASNLYELAINNIKAEPQISALHTTFHVNSSRYSGYSFNESTPKWLTLLQLSPQMFIVTETVALTSMKAMQCLRNLSSINKYAVLDIECVANLPMADFCSLQAELRKTEKVLLIVWRNTDSSAVSHATLQAIAQATAHKQIVMVTDDVLMDKVIEHFPRIKVFRDETQNITSMTMESQKELRKNCKVIFQGVALSLDLMLDDVSLSFIEGVVLDKLTRNETISLGVSLSNPRYEEVKHLYIDRSVCWVSEDNNDEHNARYLVKTFHDVADEVVFLTAPPGMGKSTLLTHLSINTKERDTTLWIVRVNFINFSKQFDKWCEEDTHVGAVEALEFLCQVVIGDESVSFSVQITNDEASLLYCAADGLITFELNMFLHYYNKRRSIFVFDGFDEICPHYKDTVVDFLIAVKTHLKKNKMWVTSRPYSDILPDLQTTLGGRFEMEHLSYQEQESFLKRFWREKSINEKLCKQLENLEVFMENAGRSISEVHEWIQFIYYNFVDVVRLLLCRSDDAEIDAHLERFRGRPLEDTMSGIPLILYFMADYFVNIVEIDKKLVKSESIINLHDVYEMFVENKLKKVLFQDKNNMELSNPITRGLIERELCDRTRVYKKLAANALIQDSIFRLLRFEEFKDMTPIDEEELNTELDRIKTGADKTGLISHVTANKVAVFIHRSFTEYFAAEYACDILKSQKFNKSKKVLWYCALTFVADKGIRDWLDAKKKIDHTLQNVLKEIEEPPPIYATDYRSYLTLDNLSQRQRIRILASSVDDYENISFTTFRDAFTVSYWAAVNDDTRQNVIEYLQSYIISRMKVHLKQHFVVPALFILRNNTFKRDYSLAPNMDKMRYFYDIRLKIEIMGQKRDVPLLMRLEHKNEDDAINFNDSGFESNNKTVSERADDTCTLPKYSYILYNNEEFTIGSYSSHEPSSVRAFNTLIATTNTVRCRLHHCEQIVQEFANIVLKKELSLFAQRLVSILSQGVSSTFVLRDFDCVQQYHFHEILEEKDNLDNPDWQILIFRTDFLDTEDTHTMKLRNYLIDEILYKPAVNLSNHLTPDELISSFLSEPSVATLTPLIGAFIVCCKEGELKFAIKRPPEDIERLRQIKIQRSAIDEALSATRTAVIEYLRSLRLKVPVDLADVELVVDGSPISFVDYAVDGIFELCEQFDQTDLYKVVTIDDAGDHRLLRYNRALAKAVGRMLTHDEQSDMLKFSNAHQFTGAQKNAKLLFEKLSDKIKNLHEYRFRLKCKKFSKLHVDCSNTAQEFLDNLAIYTERGSRHWLKNILERESPQRSQQYKHFTIKSQLSLLHYHSETVKWWTSLTTNTNLTKTLFRYADGIVKWISRGTDTRRTETRDLYRLTSYNITTEPLISEFHTKFHMKYFKYLGNSFNKRNSKWKEILEIPCRTLIETDTVAPTAIEVIQFLKNNDSDNNYTILELDYVFSLLLDNDRGSLWAELRQTDKVLIIVWHAPRTTAGDTVHELAVAIKHKNIIVVTNNESRENRYLLNTNRIFNCKTELWS
ncbi:unnamed protein product [Arctia plantaginis]|uniref:NACHT domain-containing protein n=1 Tax=Arctia plantaginis TaxID=874455 RepID=A0A8S1AL59_ARCPL|nr:unnamed protein product [Arctia plantaginis]